MKVVVKGEYNIFAYRAFYKYHAYRMSKSIYFILLLGLLILYLAITQTIEVLNSNGEIEQANIIFVWALFFATFLLTPFIMSSNRSNMVRKEADKRGKSIEIIEASKEKISVKIGDQGKIYVNWKNIETIREVEDYFFVFTGGNQGFAIAKNMIVEGDAETFKKLAMANLIKNKKGKVPYKSHLKKVKT